MSSSDSAPRGEGLRTEVMLIGAVVIAGLALLLYLSAQRQTVLRKSAVGFDGLQIWLTAEAQSARSFTGGWTIDPGTVGLLVQPIYDARHTSRREPPRTKEELLMQEEEFDQRVATVLEKSRKATSLVILPKWRSGMRLTGLAHPVLLNREGGPRYVLSHLLNENGVELTRIAEPFVDFDYDHAGIDETLTARLYVPQVFRSDKCSPIVGTREAMVLGWCDGHRSGFYLLSDPDLFNNHGLRLADNARVASAFIAAVSEGQDVVIDYSASDWFVEAGRRETYDRTWDDFKRFFGPPFLMLWLAVAAVLALVLWRAGRRDRPLKAGPGGPGSAKALAIRARARLMRLTDHDGALVGDYARARLAALGAELFGPAHGLDDTALQRQIGTAFPAERGALEQALADIRALPAKTRAAEAIAQVNTLETTLEKLTHEPR